MSRYELRAASSIGSLNDLHNFAIDTPTDERGQSPPPPKPAKRVRRTTLRERTIALPERTIALPGRRTPGAVEAGLVDTRPIETIAAPPPVAAVATQPAATDTAPVAAAAATAQPAATDTAPLAPALAAQTVRTGDPYTDSVVVLPQQYRSFRRDDAARYQTRIKPLTAPALAPTPEAAELQIDIVRAAQRLYFYNYDRLQAQDWYDFLVNEVMGGARRDEKEFLSIQKLPTPGVGGRGGRGASDEPLLLGADVSGRGIGAGTATLATPFGGSGRPRDGGAPPGWRDQFDDDDDLLGNGPPPPGWLPAGQGAPLVPAPAAGGAVAGLGPLPQVDRFGAAAAAVLDDDPQATTIRAGDRFSDLQAHLGELLDRQLAADTALAANPADQARIRRERRKATFDAGVWLNDPTNATGYVVLNPLYVSAKRDALRQLRFAAAGTSLAEVPEREYIRRRPDRVLPDGRRDFAWQTVRSMFGALVRNIFLLNRLRAGQGVRYADDVRLMTRQINADLSSFVYRVGYNAEPGFQTFYIINPRNDERRQPVFARASELRFTPYESTLGPQYGGGEAPSLVNRSRITLAMLAR